ncbi:hemoglobin subunit alpha-5-like isoform 2-T4 [Anomaloglossus baeobatrachus]|uniref:hemoglobin subunit alpha-5-like isoform X1 n=1 Tax=Anomaloglossus baeobatrachus TaxID=238106 RepID=UPI003F50BA97
MSFSDAKKAFISSMGAKISDPAVANELGAKFLESVFLNYPQMKLFFSHLNTSPGSQDLNNYGGKIMKAIGNAAQNLDNLSGALSPPNDLQPQDAWAKPDNFKVRSPFKILAGRFIKTSLWIMSNTLNGVLAKQFPSDFYKYAELGWSDFMINIFFVLRSKSK